ncbi:hypothetical protein U9M48_029338 [Paspalum notatum var. saurae]|uniref:Glabrous enhancer-binding protein-like DBD domain-containing protein n=1 Tax=Paspalum notatum var. saurae TaxID=547442 RepID=A0AAQ3U315_PASNO
MPSKRPSAHAMDAAAAAASSRLRPSTPRSKKRSKSRSRSRDGRRSPNPNPSSRRDRASASAAAPSRKSDRRPKPRSFPDSATLATAMAAAAAAAPAAAPATAHGGHGGARGGALWGEADEVALLTGAAAFKDRNGYAPRLPDMADLFDSIRDSLAPHLDQAKVYYKLKRLKSKYQHSAPGGSGTAHDRRVRDLCAALWGAELARPADNNVVVEAEEAEDEEEDGPDADGGDRDGAAVGGLPMVREVLGDYWRLNGQALSGVSLEKGLALLGSQQAGVAELKWRRQLEEDMRMQMRRHDLGKEVRLVEYIDGYVDAVLFCRLINPTSWLLTDRPNTV